MRPVARPAEHETSSAAPVTGGTGRWSSLDEAAKLAGLVELPDLVCPTDIPAGDEDAGERRGLALSEKR